MSCYCSVRVQEQDFDLSTEVADLRSHTAEVGAIASFVGVVRDTNLASDIQAMELEHYPGMTEKSIQDIIDQACERWQIYGVTVIHRIGKLNPTDQIVLVAVSSMHRGDAFSACEFIMDYLKVNAPFWKKEHTPEGARWVDARCSDDSAAERWALK